jgi:hypothetical protein
MTDIADPLAPITLAEEKLLAGCSNAERIVFGDGECPAQNTPDVTIRGSVLRALLLDEAACSLNAKGLRIRGAYITGPVDVQGTTTGYDITFSQCTLDSDLNLVNADLRGLHLMGCQTKGISADNAGFSGSVYLRGGCAIMGEVTLAGTRIGGDLQVCGVSITSPTQDAIFAPSLRVEGSIFLGNYPYADGETTLNATGMLFFSSARVAHDFFVTNSEVSVQDGMFEGASFGGTEEHGSDIALSLARAQVGGILYLQNNQIQRGIVNLAGATVGRLTDEPRGPGANYPIRLDGFRYGDFSRHTDTSLTARLDWLERRPADTPFVAQPYEQLAYVLTRLGHRTDAQSVLMRKERYLRRENRNLVRGRTGRGVRWGAMVTTDWLIRITIGYGYRPGRALIFAVFLISALAVFYQRVWDEGDFAPNAAPILVSADWIAATRDHPDTPAAIWSAPGAAGQDYETFNSVAYAADLVIPLVSFGQETAWAPSTSRSPWGQIGWWLRWLAKIVGWIVTALGAAALTGIIRKE